MCLIQAKRLAIHANQNLYPQFLGDQQATPEIQRANLMQIKDEMDWFVINQCSQIESQDAEINLLYTQAEVILLRAMEKVERKLSEP
jgi:hypothetical protein